MQTREVDDRNRQAVWAAYQAGRPTRVPVMFYTNPRVVILNDDWNPGGVTFQQVMTDPKTHVQVSLQHQLYRRRVIGRYSDDAHELPDVWPVDMMVYNIFDAAYLGAPVHCYDDQVPDTTPCLDDANRDAVFDLDIDRPLDNPFIKGWLDFWREMDKVCDGMTFEGRPVELKPWLLPYTDGPVTVGMNLRGSDFLMDLVADPDYADRLMRFIVDAAAKRREALYDYWGDRAGPRENGFADDSVAMLGLETYTQRVMPMHRRWYESIDAPAPRGIHLCGDATRLFPTIHQQLGVMSFDTGFPVDHGALRDQLGEDVEILGGPEVATLLNGSPDDVYQRARQILTSGVKRGGRFLLREGNNLPPNVPEANLQAMYQAALDHGQY